MTGVSIAEANRADSDVRPRIIIIYGLIGPLVGGLIVHLLFVGFAAFSDYWWGNLKDDLLGTLLGLVGGLIGFPLMGYMFGGVQALLTGALIKAIAGREGRFGYATALAAATMVCGGVSFLLAVAYIIELGSAPASGLVALAAIGVAASLIVRFLFRKKFRKVRKR